MAEDTRTVTTIKLPKVPVQKVRESIELDQYDFAYLFGVTKELVQRWENEEQYPPMAVRVVLKALNNAPGWAINTLKATAAENGPQEIFEVALLDILTGGF